MNTLDPETLDHVNGGVVASRTNTTSTSTSITDSLNAVNTQLQQLATNNSNNNNNPMNNLMLPIAFAMLFKNQRQTVITSGGTVVA